MCLSPSLKSTPQREAPSILSIIVFHVLALTVFFLNIVDCLREVVFGIICLGVAFFFFFNHLCPDVEVTGMYSLVDKNPI